MGAALAYYTVFSIAPLLLIAIGVAGLAFGEDAARGAIFAQLRDLLGEEGAAAVQGLVKSASGGARGTFATVVGLVTLFIGATGVFGELQSDLDRIWRSPASTKTEGIWALARGRLLQFGLVVAIGFLLLVSLIVSAGLAALGQWWGERLGDATRWLLNAINVVVGFGVTTALFALIYKILPRARIGWRDVWIGAAVTALLFTLGKTLIGLYLGRSAIASGFGAAGSFVLLLVWVYYSAQIFLLGAEFTWVYAYRFGSHRHDPLPEPPLPAARSEAGSRPGDRRPQERALHGRGTKGSPRHPSPR